MFEPIRIEPGDHGAIQVDPLIVMAQALESASEMPQLHQTPPEYIRNDAFRTMARALRTARETAC